MNRRRYEKLKCIRCVKVYEEEDGTFKCLLNLKECTQVVLSCTSFEQEPRFKYNPYVDLLKEIV